MKPVAYMADGEVFLDQRCITLEKPTELYTADQLCEAQVKVLREAAENIIDKRSPWFELIRMADEIERSKT
jgi:hypothetical protein